MWRQTAGDGPYLVAQRRHGYQQTIFKSSNLDKSRLSDPSIRNTRLRIIFVQKSRAGRRLQALQALAADQVEPHRGVGIGRDDQVPIVSQEAHGALQGQSVVKITLGFPLAHFPDLKTQNNSLNRNPSQQVRV